MLLWALVLYVLASELSWVQEKINRLPLRYFDSIQRGELLSRVINDVDNISQSLQQSLSQAVTSLLPVAGVLVMMFLLSPTLALIAWSPCR